MTAPTGKGGLRVVINNDRVLMGFFKFRDGPGDPALYFDIIEKKTGTYLEIDTTVMSVNGKSLDDVSEPDVTTGHCTLLGG
jgi:hypothetical protein